MDPAVILLKMKSVTSLLTLLSFAFVFSLCKAGNGGNGNGGSTSSGPSDRNPFSNYYSAFMPPTKVVDGKCEQTVSVAGYGIKDVLNVDCSIKRYVITNDDQLVVGETIYSAKPKNQEPSTLVVIRDGVCEQRTYKDGVYSSSSILTTQDCDSVKQAMKKETDEWHQGGGSEGNNDNSGNNNSDGGDQEGNSGSWNEDHSGSWGQGGWGQGKWSLGNLGQGGWGQGDWGQGDWGQGDWGQGDWGQGDWGQGDWGQGDWGQGDWGQGDWGQGDWGQGDWGQGDWGQGNGNNDGDSWEEIDTAKPLLGSTWNKMAENFANKFAHNWG